MKPIDDALALLSMLPYIDRDLTDEEQVWLDDTMEALFALDDAMEKERTMPGPLALLSLILTVMLVPMIPLFSIYAFGVAQALPDLAVILLPPCGSALVATVLYRWL